MSFILDALKKLEQKKQKGAVPGIMTIHTPARTESKRRPLWPYVVIAALLLNAGILAFIYYSPKAGQEMAASPAVPENQATSSAAVPSEQQQILTMKNPDETPPVAVKEKIDGPLVNSSEPVQQHSAPKDVSSAPGSSPGPLQADAYRGKEQPEEGAVSAGQGTTQEPAESMNFNLSAQELDTLRSKIKEEQSLGKLSTPSVPEPAGEAETATATETAESIPELSQLPSNIKSELPAISITGHIYSNDPGSRIATVNGEIVREGENVEKGLKVDEITVNGILFSFKGVRFLVRAF